MSTPALATFELAPDHEATAPPEERGVARDGVRMMVAHRSAESIQHSRFDRIAEHLAAGDALVVNVSRTLPAAVTAISPRGRELVLHFSSPFPADERLWVVEPRLPAGPGTTPFRGLRAGDRLALPGGASIDLRGAVQRRADVGRPRPGSPARWRATSPAAAGRCATPTRPATGTSTPTRRSSASSPAAPRCRARGARSPSARSPRWRRETSRSFRSCLHCGVSSLEDGESPLPERFAVSAASAARLNAARGAGGRVVAIGTTAVRALESAADAGGEIHAASGWTDVVIGPGRPVTAVDGLLTGWHEPAPATST